jgi:intein/homing endonuclease
MAKKKTTGQVKKASLKAITSSTSNSTTSSKKTASAPVVVKKSDEGADPRSVAKLTDNEMAARRMTKTATTTTSGFFKTAYGSGDVSSSSGGNFYSPQLSTDFLEKPQNLRERRAWYRHFYNANEFVGSAIDLHSTIPISKIRLSKPKCANTDMAEYVYDFFTDMCDRMKLFHTLIEVSHEYWLLGNCAEGSSKVRTPDGYVRIDSIEKGEKVLTHVGTFEEVEHVQSFPNKEIIEISVHGRVEPLKVTGEHPVEVLRDGEFVFVEAKDITKDDYIKQVGLTDIVDVDSVDYVESYPVTSTDEGYQYAVTVNRKRNEQAQRVRVLLLDFLSGIGEPVKKTRSELAKNFSCSESTLNNVITSLNKEVSTSFHRRVGASGYQKGSQVEWVPIDMEESEALKGENYTISRTSSFKTPHSLDIDEDFLYLLGYWLGDGTLSRDSSRPDQFGRGIWYVCFSEEHSPKQLDKVRGILKSKLGASSIRESKSKGMIYLHVKSNPVFIEWWSTNFGNTCLGSVKKRIPDWIKTLPVEKITHLIGGLIDSDGCFVNSSSNGKKFINLQSSSESLSRDIWELSISKGLTVLENSTDNSGKEVILPQGSTHTQKGSVYVINFVGEETCSRIEQVCEKSYKDVNSEYRESESTKVHDGFLVNKVISISDPVPTDVVFNLQVANEHTFVIEGHSTHNCFMFAEESDPYATNHGDAEAKKKVEELKQRGEQKSNNLLEKFDITDKDPNYMGWDKIIILPPDQVRIQKVPFSDRPLIEYIPDPATRDMILNAGDSNPMLENLSESQKPRIPGTIVSAVEDGGSIPLDSDPYSGSHCHHLARKKSQYETYGTSILERCVNTLLLNDKLRQAQTSIASRHMTPIRVVWAEELSTTDVDDLRMQVDMALMDPDFSIVANYQINWEEFGVDNRLLELSTEYDHHENSLFAGLGVTREMLTGEGVYSGSRINLEILNQQYLLFREVLQDYVEENLFKPVARKKGFVETDKFGREKLIYPRLSFTRLAIRDNDSFFDQAMQLYNKGSISIDVILDMLNIDSDSTKKKIESDLFTVNDAAMQDLLRAAYGAIGNELMTKTNVMDKVTASLGLEALEGGGEEEGGDDLGGDGGSPRFASNLNPTQKAALDKLVALAASNPDKLDKIANYLGK